ncbi:MAG TPA: hypothetical protein VGZ03_09160 [Acidimicrobiales bacterium]|jgi:hypothetical protein|nr:hypothetical protein [Acidimicrobiales bacterium]
MPNWVVISSLATAGGTLVLAGATFASVRSANRSARVAEESLLAGMRPLLMPSRPEDPPIKVGFADDHFVQVRGNGGTAEILGSAIYLTMSVRNAGTGIAVLHGWRAEMTQDISVLAHAKCPDVESFRRLTRDLYIAAGDVSFWQGAIRDSQDADAPEVSKRIRSRERFFVDLLYGDHRGGQRVVSRFSVQPRESAEDWYVTVSRHWNVDLPDPR